MKTKIVPHHYHDISQLFDALQLPGPVHKHVGLLDYSTMKVTEPEVERQFIFDFYTLTFKRSFKGKVGYGQGFYNFKNGGLLFTAPRQIIFRSECNRDNDGYTLFFHAELFKKYNIRDAVTKYDYFSYGVHDALHLNEAEKDAIGSILNLLTAELSKAADQNSQDIYAAYIELLLSHSNRFYSRQFINNENKCDDILGKLEVFLKQFYKENRITSEGLPTVQQAADYLGVSTRNLNDTLRIITGYNTKYHLHTLLIEKAKIYLSTKNDTIAEIAYKLGFRHPQSFNKLFKSKAGQSPMEYRRSFP
jgi:AraC family transcriptional regulator, transcriptional activator of pobA